MPSLRLVASFLLGSLLFAVPAAATWSIVVVDLATGEVAIGIATCLTGFDLRPNTVVVVPGYGVAAAQSFVGPLSLRQLIREGLLNGVAPVQILQQLAAADGSHQMRQYGIVALAGGEETFTGAGAGAWAGGLTGQSGTLRYAIQGNVLTGQPVITAAEQALINTPGSLPDKLMAAMDAARQMGGDGRCSCSPSNPPGCGSPPPNFSKSSHIALMIVSRPSDLDSPCTGGGGCGAGDYWLDINIANQPASAPDPVIQLQNEFNIWKANQVGRPDHFQSTASIHVATIRANGIDTAIGTVQLRDAQGTPLGTSLPITVDLAPNSTVQNVVFGPAVPQANGTYQFTIQGDLSAGVAVLDIAAHDPFGRVGIWPRPMLTIEELFGPCGAGAVPDGSGGVLDALQVNGSAGVDRVVEVGYAQPFTLSLAPPGGQPGGGPVGMFALWALLGMPTPGVELPLGIANSLCFVPAPFSAAPTMLVADSFGFGGSFAAGPAPWSQTLSGVPAVLDTTLQAAMVADPSGALAATNAVYVRFRPLPVPTITSLLPQAPVPGQVVTVTGADFYPGVAGAVGATPVQLTWISPTSVEFVAPAGIGCDAMFHLHNPGGATVSAPINATPIVNYLPFTSGPAAGGAPIYIVGNYLAGTSVTINGAPIQVTTQSQ
ncbi:MAG TPA: DUF1028 domain-containing protein, partial [bacterium]|nr:DUF1028 domain-containing protein [bacterium]